MAKKQFNVRLSEDALLGIKVAAREWGCSEAEVIERWARGGVSSSGRTAGFEPVGVGSIPAAPASKREVFEGLKAKLEGGGKLSEMTEPVRLLDAGGQPKIPTPPFDFSHPQNGETHRIRTIKNVHYLFYLGEDGENSLGPLRPGELEKFWEKRIVT